jgi:hypothetical protein
MTSSRCSMAARPGCQTIPADRRAQRVPSLIERPSWPIEQQFPVRSTGTSDAWLMAAACCRFAMRVSTSSMEVFDHRAAGRSQGGDRVSCSDAAVGLAPHTCLAMAPLTVDTAAELESALISVVLAETDAGSRSLALLTDRGDPGPLVLRDQCCSRLDAARETDSSGDDEWIQHVRRACTAAGRVLRSLPSPGVASGPLPARPRDERMLGRRGVAR